jgi:hypothetical protein
MKKIVYTLLSVAFISVSAQVNSSPSIVTGIQLEIASPQMTTTDIFNYLNTNLGLSATQKPTVKTAVDQASAEVTKLNADATKSATEVAAAKTNIVNALIKKLSSGILTGAQSTKLSGLTSTLTSMFSQLK